MVKYFNTVEEEQIKKELQNYIDKYTQSQEMNIFIGSWNVAGNQTKDDMNLLDWLRPKSMEQTPDIYCIGLQEIVELNASNVLISSNSNRVDYWKNNIVNNLKVIDKYR
jgi:hypothetical protein